MNFETITCDIDTVRTVVKAIGAGPAVLALHGAATIEGHDWARGLADRFRVYLPFHPGFGESGDAPHLSGMQDMTVHTLRLIRRLGLVQPHLIGHSMGGWMASELAVMSGGQFGKLVLVAPAGLNHPDHPAADLAAIAPEALPGYLSHDAAVAARYFPGGALCRAPANFAVARARENAALQRILMPHGMGHPNLGRWLDQIANDTLIVWGAHDRMAPASQVPVWTARIPNARAHVVTGAGHFVMQENPESVRAIGDFLAAASPSRAEAAGHHSLNPSSSGESA